jgi:hypothetical protein
MKITKMIDNFFGWSCVTRIERPTRVRTWAPSGQTPVLQYSFSWKRLSAIAGFTFWNFYFRLK